MQLDLPLVLSIFSSITIFHTLIIYNINSPFCLLQMNHNTINFQNQESKIPKEEEDHDDHDQEEALSLSDFPLNSDQPERKDTCTIHHRRQSHPSDSFEFFNDPNSDNTMSHAEDIISCGKLMPYKQQSFFDDQILKSMSEDYDSINLTRRYCDSLPELNPTRSNSKTLILRSSRSLDDSKQSRRNSSLVMKSDASDIHRSSSKGSVKSEGSTKGSKPRWYGLMFGVLKFPPEIDLQDMKNRQVRRIPGRMLPEVEAGGGTPANRRSSWGHDLLRVLSCKNQPSVSVTASIRLVPQV